MKKCLHFRAAGVKGRCFLYAAARVLAAVLLLTFLFFLPASSPTVVEPAANETRNGSSAAVRTVPAGGISLSSSGRKSAKKLASSNVRLSRTQYKYDGHSKTPSVTVNYNGKRLRRNRDYTLSYTNNKKRGTAKVIVRGKSGYTGTVTKTFKIK